MWPRYTLLYGFVAISAAACLAGKATAEILNALLPDGIPGYDTDPGVTVTTRQHAEQMPLGLRDGPLIVSPRLDVGTGYSSNAVPGSFKRGSWQVTTAPLIGLATDWSTHQLGAVVSARDTRVLSLPAQSRTDVTASAGARLDTGDGTLTLAAAHIDRHEDRGEVGTLPSDRPVPVRIDDVRAVYALVSGPWTFAPEVEFTNWTYGAATLRGLSANQSYRDRSAIQAGLTMRYDWASQRGLVLVANVTSQDYAHTPIGQASQDSVAFQVLAGIDYDDDTVWHGRALLGNESRRFARNGYKSQDTVIAEAAVGWSPSGMTALTMILSRETNETALSGLSGAAYTAARVVIDHEYLRNVLLRAYAAWQQADFFQGGRQQGTTAGVGLTWVLNRSLRLIVTYDQADLRGSATVNGAASPGYSRGLGLVTVRMDL